MKRIIVLFCMLCQTAWLSAQITPYTEKFFLNFELNSQAISFDDDNLDNDRGGGLGLRAGYGFTPTFALYLGLTGARMRNGNSDAYGLGMAELGTRLHFGRKLRSPTFYLDIAFQAISAEAESPDLSFSGGGLGLGGGLLVYLGQGLALDFGLRGSAGDFNEFRLGGLTVNIDEENIRYGAGRLSVGITWFPAAN